MLLGQKKKCLNSISDSDTYNKNK